MNLEKKYILKDLLKIRQSREENAARALAAQKIRVEEAEELVQQRQRELESYHAWRIDREAELYEEIIDRTIEQKDLESVRFKIQQIRDKEHEYEGRVIQAKEQLEEEKRQLVEDQQAYQQAVHKREKLDEHKQLWITEAKRVAELNAEKELEDFKNRRRLAAFAGL
ncbi:YscO family type III secretion system apparatus protein [Thalassoglobus sp. JC818]|uniref:type III secretion system stalk subunit SctO n=1 Tax=Thalassoglobus sp. JC818 TaxID=3232136 RepID=UPI00345ABE8B